MGEDKIGKIGIVGLGLIGGSIAIELSKNHTIIGKDTNLASVDFCLQNKYIHQVATDYSDLFSCKVIFVCVPVALVKQTCCDIFDVVGYNSIITDVASVKGILKNCKGRIVGGHPMAGTEFCGSAAAKPKLFVNAPYYLIKYASTSQEDYNAVKQLITDELGANVIKESHINHDKIVSLTSHLPHMIAYSLASVACGKNSKNAGNSLKDTTRIAGSDPNFWANVARLNKNNLIDDLDNYIKVLSQVSALIKNDNFLELENFLTCAQEKKLKS